MESGAFWEGSSGEVCAKRGAAPAKQSCAAKTRDSRTNLIWNFRFRSRVCASYASPALDTTNLPAEQTLRAMVVNELVQGKRTRPHFGVNGEVSSKKIWQGRHCERCRDGAGFGQ